MKYRGEAEDARRLVAELGGRSREDVESIASLKAELEDSNNRKQTQQVIF